MARSYDLEFRLERAKKMERARIRKGWSNILLASKSGYDEKTIRKLLRGEPTRDKTVTDVCEALGIEAELVNTIEEVDVADDIYGGYTRSTHRSYEGFFQLYRPSFTKPGLIFRGIVNIEWDSHTDVFTFSDYYSVNPDSNDVKAHAGNVCISSYTNLLHLMTVYEGSVRLMTLTKMREKDGILRGTIQTQSESLMFFQPTVAPVVLRKLQAYDPANSLVADIGLINEADPDWAFAQEQLTLTEHQILKVVSWSSPLAPKRRVGE